MNTQQVESKDPIQVSSSINEITHKPCTSTPVLEAATATTATTATENSQRNNSKRPATETDSSLPAKVAKATQYPERQLNSRSAEEEGGAKKKVLIVAKTKNECGDSEGSSDAEVVTTKKTSQQRSSQQQCFRTLNRRLATNIERIGPIVTEHKELLQMNDLLRSQIQRERDEQKAQMEKVNSRLDKAIQEKVQAEIVLRISEENVHRLKDEVYAGRRIFSEFRRKEAALKAELSSLCNAASVRDAQMDELRKAFSVEQQLRLETEQMLKESTTCMTVAQNKLQNCLEELAAEHKRVEELQSKTETLQQEKVALEARLNTTSEQNRNLSLELTRLRDEHDVFVNEQSARLNEQFRKELCNNYVPKVDLDHATQLVNAQLGEIDRLNAALNVATIRRRETEQQHEKLLREWHEDRMHLHDCRKEMKTFKLLIDQMDLATPKDGVPSSSTNVPSTDEVIPQTDAGTATSDKTEKPNVAKRRTDRCTLM